VRIIDPANKIRDEVRDALGRLVTVVEAAPTKNYSTTYTYDPLDNLLGVTQGAQTRSFAYDSLGRLREAKNPEWTNPSTQQKVPTTYAYYASGDLRTRTDPNGKTTTYVYDALHRITSKTYSDSTPPATYAYYQTNETPPNIGQLKSVSSTVATTTYSLYDALSRVKTSTQTIAGLSGNYEFGYEWYLNNALKQTRYPSGRLVNYDVDDAGRVNLVCGGSCASSTDTLADMRETETDITTPYAPDGRLLQMKLGNGVFEKRDYQKPGTETAYDLRPTLNGTPLLRLEYDFDASDNNGNVIGHRIINGSTTWTQTFEYDELNRLSVAWENVAGQNNVKRVYGYDRYGNRWVNEQQSTWTIQTDDVHEPGYETNFDANTNRLVSPVTYDTAGNQTLYTPYTLWYDAENRNYSITSPNNNENGSIAFAYDGDGRRVKKSWSPNGGNTITTYYVYDAFGQLAAEYSNGTPANGMSFPFNDMLGSVRGVTNGSGALDECNDYLPFGRTLVEADHTRPTCHPNTVQSTSKLPQKFTGKERDLETGWAINSEGLDFFLSRYYSGAQGRFTSPDSTAYSKMTNPQSWNLYAYSFNNPLRYTDPDGHEVQTANCTTEEECNEVLKGIKGAVGSAAGDRLRLTPFTQKAGLLGRLFGAKDTTGYRVSISGDTSSFRALGDNASRLADLVGSSQVITAQIATHYPGPGGGTREVQGGFSQLTTNPMNVYVQANPSSFDPDTRGFIGTGFGAIPGANFGETMAHELLGHTWGHLFGNAPRTTLGNLRESVLAENQVRRTDPSRGIKIYHQGTQAITREDLDRLRKK